MKTRIISGAVYVAILTVFFLLRQLVHPWIFHLLTYFFIVVGTYELARATKKVTIKGTEIMAVIFSILFVPVYFIFEHFVSGSHGFTFACYLTALMVIINLFLAINSNADLKKTCWTILNYLYPTMLLVTMLLANDMGDNAFIVLLLAFVISPISDTFAYFVGCKIGGKKLCPKLSPKKTWSGAIGGTIGGMIFALIAGLIVRPNLNVFSPAVFYFLVGLLASVVNIFGDLTESYIKRKMRIKDMGKIMPGHGGVLDRIDGTMFVIVVLYIMFLFV